MGFSVVDFRKPETPNRVCNNARWPSFNRESWKIPSPLGNNTLQPRPAESRRTIIETPDWTSRKPRMKVLLPALALALLALLPACETVDKNDKPRVSPSWSEKIDSQLANADKKAIPAQYADLKDRTVAVFVDVPDKFVKDFPQSQREIARKVSRYLSDYVTGVKVVNPDQVVDFQRGTPQWREMSFETLVKTINVERIVLVDITQIEINDPQDASEHLGLIVGKVGVIEYPQTAAEASDEETATQTTNTVAGSGELAFINAAAAYVATDEAKSSADFADRDTLKFQLEWRFATKVGHLFVNHY